MSKDWREAIRIVVGKIIGVEALILTPFLFPVGYISLWLLNQNGTIKEEWETYKEVVFDFIKDKK